MAIENTLPSGPDACLSGSVCADPMATGQSRCMYFCQEPFGYCPEGVCAYPLDLADGSPFLCLPSDGCNALASPSTCDASVLLVRKVKLGVAEKTE